MMNDPSDLAAMKESKEKLLEKICELGAMPIMASKMMDLLEKYVDSRIRSAIKNSTLTRDFY